MNNRILLIEMARALQPLLDKLVFVGGCAVDLLVDDEAADDIRVTGDVDVIAEIATRIEYYALIDELRQLGFHEVVPTEDEPAPICRLSYENMILDVMPTDERVLGFSNKWYLPAVKNANIFELEQNLFIKVVSPAYFIATKLIAFRTRGKSDYYCHDMEDIITVYNGNSSIVSAIKSADSDVRQFIRSEFNILLADRGFKVNCIAGHLSYESKQRFELVFKRISDSIMDKDDSE